MLQNILNATDLDARTLAGLLGVNPDVFAAWACGQEAIPESYLPLLGAVLSVPPSTLFHPARANRGSSEKDSTPQIWFKFRGRGLVQADREYVVMIRMMGHYLNELEEVTRKKSVQWRTVFETIRGTVSVQAPVKEQGKSAARLFRQSTSLGHGATGAGEVLRGFLRSMGILAVEIPIVDSIVEGCSFYVGAEASPRPCVFANSHHATWFRRNEILMHELGHAIFEPFTGATLDLVNGPVDEDIEIRAQAFAQEVLVPREVLLHAAQSLGCKWNALSAESLANLVASTHVEPRTLLSAAQDAGFLDVAQADEFSRIDISKLLRRVSEHALSTEEYLERAGTIEQEWIGKRTTSLSARPMRLPIGYVNAVVEAYNNRQISPSKAATYLMIEEGEFVQRFGEIYEEVET